MVIVMPEVEEEHTKNCELTHVWYEWIGEGEVAREVIAVDMKDPTDGKTYRLMTKNLVLHKLKRGHPL